VYVFISLVCNAMRLANTTINQAGTCHESQGTSQAAPTSKPTSARRSLITNFRKIRSSIEPFGDTDLPLDERRGNRARNKELSRLLYSTRGYSVDLTSDRWGLAARPAQQSTSYRSLPSTWLRVKRRSGCSNALPISSPRHRASLLVSLDRRVAQTVLQRIERSFATGYPSTNPQQHTPVDQLHLSILLL